MFNKNFITVFNGLSFPLSDIPILDFQEFYDLISDQIKSGCRVLNFFGKNIGDGEILIYAVIGRETNGEIYITSAKVKERYKSLTTRHPQFHMFEREIFENFGVIPEGHKELKPVRNHLNNECDFLKIEGKEIHEVGVGPIHAGVIEPGHFRFQCIGERVLNLEIALGYQHRGIEKKLIGGPDKRTLPLIETVSGDSTIAYCIAYSRIIEALSDTPIPLGAEYIRAVLLELERMANHIGDLGALSGDTAYLPTASFCGRIRGDYLNMTADFCGNRFGRGIVVPGGIAQNITIENLAELQKKNIKFYPQVKNSVDLMWKTSTVLSRLEDTGRVTSSLCRLLGIVGVAARACGIKRDVRSNFPYGFYKNEFFESATEESGDVYARAFLRWKEIVASTEFIKNTIPKISLKNIYNNLNTMLPNLGVVSLVEGWRGEVCHVAMTDHAGKFDLYKICDPSFHNWTALAHSLRQEEIYNFPLCNKSFNLSYCGHDL